jgi:hypothetical protein
MDSRTKLLLGVLAFIGLLSVWIWIGPGGGGSEEAIAPLDRVPGSGRATAATATRTPPVERVEEPLFAGLAVRPRELTPGRDPWRFGATPQPARVARPRVVVPAPAPVTQPVAPPPAPRMTAPEPPVFPWKLLGSFGPAGRRIAVFAEGAAVHNVREGEILAERFVLERVGLESADVRPLGFSSAPAQRLVPGGRRGGA